MQLSRHLAATGMQVLYTYCASLETPRGCLEKKKTDHGKFRLKPLDIGRDFKKYGLLSRAMQEMELGRVASKVVQQFRPDYVLSANTPIFTQAGLLRGSRKWVRVTTTST